jgi:hypothetical protein
MWRLLKLRLNEYEAPVKGMNDLFERSKEVWYDTVVLLAGAQNF